MNPYAKNPEQLPARSRFLLARSWFWLVPTVGIFLVLISLGALLWSTYLHNLDENRRTLISDTLWAEQNWGFHLRGNEAVLGALAQEIPQRQLTPNDVWIRARNLLTNNPELVQLTWEDSSGKKVLGYPAETSLRSDLETSDIESTRDELRIVRSLGRPSYTAPYEKPGEGWCFEVHVPIFDEVEFTGQLIGVYSLNSLMAHLVPWWHAQKYNLSILDASGKVIASKSKIAIDTKNPSYEIPIDPPGYGLAVRATPYSQRTGLLQNSLVAAIILLSAAVIWSLLILRRHAHERFIADQKLRFNSRLVMMGEMASILAHELNQPLSAITSYVTGSLNKLEAGNLQEGELSKVLQTTATQAQRAGKIIRRVHEFVRRREPRRVPCDINQAVEEAFAFVEWEARSLKVRINFELDNNLPILHADNLMLQQVILNLARNGLESMSESPIPTRMLRVKTANRGNAIVVSIIDCGCGIAPEDAEKIFAAFYSTKEKGMGMGLNICRSIIEFHRGKLWFEPNLDGGSSFCFSLPIVNN